MERIKDREAITFVLAIKINRPKTDELINKHLYRLSEHLDNVIKNEYGGILNIRGASVTVEDENGNNIELPYDTEK